MFQRRLGLPLGLGFPGKVITHLVSPRSVSGTFPVDHPHRFREVCTSCSTEYQVRAAGAPPGPGWAKRGGCDPPWAVKSLWDRKGRTKASTMKWATRGRWEVGASRLWGQGEGFHCRLLAQALTGAQAQCTPPPDLSSPSLPISPCPSLLRPLRTSTLLSFSQKPPQVVPLHLCLSLLHPPGTCPCPPPRSRLWRQLDHHLRE